MTSSYRETAENCFRMARSASHEEDKSRWTKMAQYWLLKTYDAEGQRPTFDTTSKKWGKFISSAR
jgi:hypothetical protein